MLPRILAVDFDGTLFENGYPGVGAPIVAPDGERLLDKVIRLQQQGWYIILWSLCVRIVVVQEPEIYI